MTDEERDHEAEGAESSLDRRVFTRRDVVKGGGATVGALSLAWLLAACGGGGGGGETTAPADTGGAAGTGAAETVPAGGGGEVETMTWAINGDAVAMDYALAYDFNTNAAMTNITEPLLRIDPEGQLQPNLAESWEQVDPTDADDQASLRRQVPRRERDDRRRCRLQPQPPPRPGRRLVPRDVPRARQGRPGDGAARGHRHASRKPDAIFPYAMGTMAGAVASKAFIEANGDKVGTPDVGIVGTGPYKFTSWTKGQEIVLDRFDDYWNTERARKVKQFVVKIILDEATIVRHCRPERSTASSAPRSRARAFRRSPESIAVEVYRAPSYQVHYLAVNTGKPPFDDPRVRQALSMAIDKHGLLQSTWGGIGQAPIKSPATPAMWTYEKDTFQQAYDALPVVRPRHRDGEGARRGGRRDGGKGNILVSLPFDEEQAVAIQAAAKEIGLDLTPGEGRVHRQDRAGVLREGIPRVLALDDPVGL